MQTITDEYMKTMSAKARTYCLVILKTTPKLQEPGAFDIIREHGRRNYALRAEGTLAIVCRVTDGGEVAGIGIFISSLDETMKILDDDPAIKAGILVYEIHPCRGQPGDNLPAI